jgi:hypothetical protein
MESARPARAEVILRELLEFIVRLVVKIRGIGGREERGSGRFPYGNQRRARNVTKFVETTARIFLFQP